MRVVNKIIKIDKKERKLYFEQFGNYQEYLRTIEDRMENNCHDKSHNWKGLTRDKDWAGVGSYEEARRMLTEGWDKEVETLKKAIAKEIDLCDSKKVVKHFNDVVGFVPIVPNVIMNLPMCMVNQRKDIKKSKVIKFLIGMNRSWAFSSKDIIDKMSKIFARICILEKHGFRCRIEMFGSHSDQRDEDKTVVAHTVLIKSENQLMDVKRVCFPIVHSAMQRVFSFGWENCLPIDYSSYHSYGLGSAIQYWNEENRNSILEAVNESGEKVVYLSMSTNVEEMFKEGGEVYGK